MALSKILEVFFKFPEKKHQIRQISRDLGISKTTVAYHINNLVKEGIIVKDTEDIFVGYRAGNSKSFKIKKLTYLLEKLDDKKLNKVIDEISKNGGFEL